MIILSDVAPIECVNRLIVLDLAQHAQILWLMSKNNILFEYVCLLSARSIQHAFILSQLNQ